MIIQLPILGFLSLFFIKKPILFHVCANVLTAANNPVKYRGIMKFAAAGYARCIVVFNKFVFKRSNVRVIVNGSELRALYARFNPVAAVSSSITSTDIAPVDSVQLPRNGQFGLLFVGRPSLEKGFDILIDALLEFKFEFTLTVIGFSSDEFRAMLPAYYSKSHSIHHRLKFLGYLNWGEEFKGVLRSNSVLVVPSRSEGTPRVILEAMSQGLPTVASRIGGIPDVVSHGESGLLFTAGSATALYDTLVAFRNNVEQQKLMRFKCLDVAKRNTIDQFADIFVKTIKDLEK